MDFLRDSDVNPRENIPQPIRVREKNLSPVNVVASINKVEFDIPRKQVTKQEGHISMQPDPFLELTPRKNDVQYKHSSVNTFVTMIKKEPKKCVKNIRLPTFANVRGYDDRGEKSAKGMRRKNLTVSSTLTSSVNSADSVPWCVHDHTTGNKLFNKERRIVKNKKSPPVLKSVTQKKDGKSNATNVEEGSTQYSKPEFNSSLKLANKLMKLNLAQSANTDLEVCLPEDVRTKILEKASAQVNIPLKTKLFKNLIAIEETPTGANKCLQEKECKTRNPLLNRPKDPQPDIEDYMHEFKTHEYCHLNLDLPPVTLPKRLTVSDDDAFNQYKLLCMWEGNSS